MNLGKKEEAMKLIDQSATPILEYMKWCESLSKGHYKAVSSEFAMQLRLLNMTIEVLKQGGNEYKEERARYETEFNKYYSYWRNRRG